ncbi:MAG: PTS sugar transporter subunit IIA [Pseudomonadota bacterium]|jgi:PTS system mannose-specific IIA component|nr:PTS sugar transporter subunit IIA [Alphaproteobacteria bacterium]
MIGVLLLTHGTLGKALIETLETIMGPQDNIRYITCNPHDDPEVKRQELHKSIDEINTGKGVVILTDMFGGTPSNLAMSVLGIKPVEVIAGVNLPMFIKFVENRNSHVLPEVAQKAFDAGRKYIQIASTLLSTPQAVNS